MTDGVESEPRNELLDTSDWFTQTTAWLPPRGETAEPLAITCLAFSLSDADRATFQEIVANQHEATFGYAAAWLAEHVTGVDSVDHRTAALFRAGDRVGAGSNFDGVVQGFVESLDLDYSTADLVQAIKDFPIQVFGSTLDRVEKATKFAKSNANVLTSTAVVVTAFGAYTGAALVIMAGTTAAVIVVGAAFVLTGIKFGRWFKRVRNSRKATVAAPVPGSGTAGEPTNPTNEELHRQWLQDTDFSTGLKGAIKATKPILTPAQKRENLKAKAAGYQQKPLAAAPRKSRGPEVPKAT